MADLQTKPLYVQTGTYTAKDDRLVAEALSHGYGVKSNLDFIASYSGATITIRKGTAFVPCNNGINKGVYVIRQTESSINTLVVGANATGDPRIDRVVLRVYDPSEGSGGGTGGKATVEIIQGVPTTGASLDSPPTMVDPPYNYMVLYDVLVNGGSSVVNGIRSKRKIIGEASVPYTGSYATVHKPDSIFSDPGGVTTEYGEGIDLAVTNTTLGSPTGFSVMSAVLQYLPDLVDMGQVPTFSFAYKQGATPIADSSFAVAIYDSSGKIIWEGSSGDSSVSGSAGDIVHATITQNSYDWESIAPTAGNYYVAFGISTSSAVTGTIEYLGSQSKLPPARGLQFYKLSTGFPASLFNSDFIDMYDSEDDDYLAAPIVPKFSFRSA